MSKTPEKTSFLLFGNFGFLLLFSSALVSIIFYNQTYKDFTFLIQPKYRELMIIERYTPIVDRRVETSNVHKVGPETYIVTRPKEPEDPIKLEKDVLNPQSPTGSKVFVLCLKNQPNRCRLPGFYSVILPFFQGPVAIVVTLILIYRTFRRFREDGGYAGLDKVIK